MRRLDRMKSSIKGEVPYSYFIGQICYSRFLSENEIKLFEGISYGNFWLLYQSMSFTHDTNFSQLAPNPDLEVDFLNLERCIQFFDYLGIKVNGQGFIRITKEYLQILADSWIQGGSKNQQGNLVELKSIYIVDNVLEIVSSTHQVEDLLQEEKSTKFKVSRGNNGIYSISPELGTWAEHSEKTRYSRYSKSS